MPLSTEDFIKQVQHEINYRFDNYSYLVQSKDWPFAQLLLEMLFDSIDPDQAFNLLVTNQEGNIKAGYKDDENGIYYLLDAHYADDPQKRRFGPGVIYNLLDILLKLTTPDVQFDVDQTILNAAIEAIHDDYEVIAILGVFGDFEDSVDFTEIGSRYESIADKLLCYDLHDLRRMYAGTNAPEGTVTLKFVSHITNYPGPVEAVIGNVDAYAYKLAVAPLTPQIFDANLRVPLGTKKSKVNQGIQKTISHSSDRRFFWYYNNGITMLCKSFRMDPGDDNQLIVEAPQIVNGAQTTDALINADFAEVDGLSFMIRVIAALPGSEQVDENVIKSASGLEDLRLDIAKYNNSQNPIQLPDFRSNEEIHRQLHNKFMEIGWYYVHRRGQWDEESSSIQTKYKDKHLEMVELAQQWYSFAGEPAVAIREKNTLFEAQGPYGKIFMFARSAEEYLVAHLIFIQVEKRIREKIKIAKTQAEGIASENDLPLTVRNYLMIGRATKRAVAHMTGLMGKALNERYGDFDQALSKKVLTVLENDILITRAYPELEDTLFRIATQLQNEKYKTMHRLLSEGSAFTELYDLFKYVIQRENDKGRDVLSLSVN